MSDLGGLHSFMLSSWWPITSLREMEVDMI